MSPTQRTLAALRKLGFRCDVVERWIKNPGHPAGGNRRDFLHIIDVLALDPERGVVGIQCCGSAFSGHLRKLTEERAQDTLDWLRTPGTSLELWGWRKVKAKRGGKAEVWSPRVLQITVDMIMT